MEMHSLKTYKFGDLSSCSYSDSTVSSVHISLTLIGATYLSDCLDLVTMALDKRELQRFAKVT